MPDIWMDVDTALAEVPVNKVPLVDDTDFKTREESVAYNAAGMDLVWNFVTSAGAMTQTAVTPTTAGDYDWTNQGNGMYSIEIPASGGASINNDTEGYGWFTGFATGILPWSGPIIGFRAAALNDALCDGGDLLDVNVTQWLGTAPATPTTAGVPEVDVTFWTGCTTFAQGGYPAVALGNTSAHGGAAASIELDELDVNTQTNLGNLTTSLFSTISGNAANLVNVTLGNVAHGGSAATLTMASATLTGNLTAGNIAADLVGDITGNLSGSAGSVTGAVGSVTGAVGSVTGAVGSVTGNVGGSVEGNVAGSVASVTGGINTGAGTITTLDALDTAQDTQHGTTRTQLDSMSGATFDTATDSLEAIRNRGDAAWTTGAGGTPPDLMQSTTIATLASQTSFTLTAGSADNDAYNGALAIITDQSTATQKAKATISDYVGSTRTVTLSSDPAIFTMAVGDSISIIAVGEAVATVDEAAIADAVLDEALSGHTTAGTLGKAIADIEADATAILADTNELQTNQGDWATATGFSTFDAGNDTVDVGRVSGNSTAADNLESFALGGALATLPKVDIQQINGGASAADDLRTVIEAGIALESTSQSILSDTAEIGAAGAGLTAAGGNGTHLTEAGGTGDQLTALSTLDAAGVRTAVGLASANLDTQLADIPTVAEFEARTIAAASYFDPATDRVLLDKADALRVTGTVNDGSATTTAFVTSLTEATDDHYIGRTVIFTSGALAGQASDITDYAGATKTITVTALTEAPANGVTFEIV